MSKYRQLSLNPSSSLAYSLASFLVLELAFGRSSYVANEGLDETELPDLKGSKIRFPAMFATYSSCDLRQITLIHVSPYIKKRS